MSNSSAIDKEVIALRHKLESEKESSTILDESLKHQYSLLSEFIIQLSKACKGVDLALDNKLAKLRTLFVKHDSVDDAEKLIVETSQILNKFSLKKEQDIRALQAEFHSAGSALQKINGLPNDLRRNLRNLLKENETSKDTLAAYIPLLSELVTFYQAALKQGNIANSSVGLLHTNKTPHQNALLVDRKVVKRFSDYLNKINVSRKYHNQLLKIQSELNDNMPNEKLLNSFLAAFDVISHDLVQERNTAKVFLSTLSETLTTVQSAVQSTISTNAKCKQKHDELNNQLENQISDMAKGLDEANSLVDIKVDISAKLKSIASTLQKKSALEKGQQAELESKLVDMQSKVNVLEQQGKAFEKRIKEQQAKSLQDALTKLYNRAAFDEHFAKEIVRCQHNNTKLAIVVADLDDFKRINDTYGHTAGDKTLQVIANTFKKHFENSGFIARYGGEEFVFIFSDKDKETLENDLNKLKNSVARLPFKFKNNKVSMTLSIGFTHITQEDNVHIAFERADTALYQAKEQGKNRVIYLKE